MITIAREPQQPTTPSTFIYSTLFLYSDLDQRSTDTQSLAEIDLDVLPPIARDFAESFYSVSGGLKRLLMKSVQNQNYTGHSEFTECHYICVDSVDMDICQELSDYCEGSRNLFVTMSNLQTTNKNTFLLSVLSPVEQKYYLSKIYPFVTESELLTSASINDTGLLRTPPESVDNTTSTAAIVGGVLRLPLFSISAPTENLASTASLPTGELRSVLIQRTLEPEQATSSATVVGGSLVMILITNTMQPEGLDSTATITGGSLT